MRRRSNPPIAAAFPCTNFTSAAAPEMVPPMSSRQRKLRGKNELTQNSLTSEDRGAFLLRAGHFALRLARIDHEHIVVAVLPPRAGRHLVKSTNFQSVRRSPAYRGNHVPPAKHPVPPPGSSSASDAHAENILPMIRAKRAARLPTARKRSGCLWDRNPATFTGRNPGPLIRFLEPGNDSAALPAGGPRRSCRCKAGRSKRGSAAG